MKLVLILLIAVIFVIAILTNYWFGKSVGINTCINYINYKYNSNGNKIIGIFKSTLNVFNTFSKNSSAKLTLYSILLFALSIILLIISFII